MCLEFVLFVQSQHLNTLNTLDRHKILVKVKPLWVLVLKVYYHPSGGEQNDMSKIK